MKVPLIWLKDYIDTKLSPSEIASKFTSLGLMLDSPIVDDILDLEHRMDRSDWLSIIGCARDLSAMENIPLNFPKTYIKKGKIPKDKDLVNIKVRGKGVVNRFNTRVFKNVKVKKSPTWLSKRLELYGIPSINNIVDITNFVMVELGQPMHAQDLSVFKKREIVIRQAKKNEKITTLLGETITLDPSVSILTENDTPICITGIVGGKRTAVTENTREIILDSGNYNQVSIRRSSRKLKIQNETVLRSDKILHPAQNQLAIERATYLILELAGGEYYENMDYFPNPPKPINKKLRYERIKEISGVEINQVEVKRILKKLEYSIVEENRESLTVEIPSFRTDVEVEDDLVSDILRISDYTNIPSSHINIAPPANTTDPIYQFEDKLRDIMVSLGANEHITEPLTRSKAKNSVKLANSLSSDKSTLRSTVYETLNPISLNYKKHNHSIAFVFEIGKTYHHISDELDYNSFQEKREICAIYRDYTSSLLANSIFVRQALASVLNQIGITDYEVTDGKKNGQIIHKGDEIGTISPNNFALDTKKLLEIKAFKSPLLTGYENTKSFDLSLQLAKNSKLGIIQSYIESYSSEILGVTLIEERLLESDKRTSLLRISTNANTNSERMSKNIADSLEQEFKLKVRR